jgi:hypothetical protein
VRHGFDRSQSAVLELVELHPAQKIAKPEIGAQTTQAWFHFEVSQRGGALLVGPFQPLERLVLLSENRMNLRETVCGHVLILGIEFQLARDAQRFRSSSGGSVAGCKRSARSGSFLRCGHGLFKLRQSQRDRNLVGHARFGLF